MAAEPPHDQRAERHRATRNRILAATWDLARKRGLVGWTLRDVGEVVGMRPPSLYVYFDSKNSLYDAMFRRRIPRPAFRDRDDLARG